MSENNRPRSQERWAHLRFAVVGGLLASPPAAGELRAELVRLSNIAWRHPTTGEMVHFSVSTIERWYYAARSANNPVTVLERKLRAARKRPCSAIVRARAQALRSEILAGKAMAVVTELPRGACPRPGDQATILRNDLRGIVAATEREATVH